MLMGLAMVLIWGEGSRGWRLDAPPCPPKTSLSKTQHLHLLHSFPPPLTSSPGSLQPQRKCFSISPSHARAQVKPQPLPQTRATPPLREGQALLTTGRSSF